MHWNSPEGVFEVHAREVRASSELVQHILAQWHGLCIGYRDSIQHLQVDREPVEVRHQLAELGVVHHGHRVLTVLL